ncbi:heterokaryon incompatibility protein-domain-containing protein [Paraphoma chrysanthemicola]|uniref:Heterokaryon incompatibility protein-domain-containing protein n=1 Tax=Paraphoma chrysanthemicola TaxID=798071 RepID=A0A8K0RJT8_9PLEO|nr:heterokaryon incompatibility protein-domain-containing protein [Paraphoma chrysanthemicola]
MQAQWSIDTCRDWIADCRTKQTHHICNRDSKRNSSVFPSRLVYVGTDQEEPRSLRLHLLKDSDKPLYLTLSHCWGGAKVFTRDPDTQDVMMRNITMERLARNFQDAIKVTRRLGYLYIWIDSLCIIQNQEQRDEWKEQSEKDWLEQSAIMGHIYRNSICTIAATGSPHSHFGFLQRTPHTSSLANFESEIQRGVEDSPLCQRAWVFQERLLTPRMLHFASDGLYWECRTQTASEFDKLGVYRQRNPNERMNGARYPDLQEILAYERDLEERLNIPNNPCMTGQNLYRRAQRNFLPPGYWKAADNRYQVSQGFPGGPIARLEDLGRFDNIGSRNNLSYHWPESMHYDFGNSYGSFTAGRSEQLAFEKVDEGWLGFRGSFAALTAQFQPILVDYEAPTVNHTLEQLLFHRRWYDLVDVYSKGALTYHKDKLTAIGGIVQQIQDNHPKKAYIHGIWEHCAHFDLLWYVTNPRSEERPRGQMFPTWTWASSDGRIADGLKDLSSWRPDVVVNMEIVSLETSDQSKSSVGPVNASDSHGTLRVRCNMMQCTVDVVSGQYLLRNEQGDTVARLFPDLPVQEGCDQVKVHCIDVVRASETTRGLALLMTSDNSGSQQHYERFGYFSTEAPPDLSFAQPMFKNLQLQEITIT